MKLLITTTIQEFNYIINKLKDIRNISYKKQNLDKTQRLLEINNRLKVLIEQLEKV